MTRYRITVRGDKCELRGYVTTHSLDALGEWTVAMRPIGVVVASPAADDFDPFHNDDPYFAEHRRLKSQLASPPPGWHVFGTHVGGVPAGYRLEFWGDDGGVPIWETLVLETRTHDSRCTLAWNHDGLCNLGGDRG